MSHTYPNRIRPAIWLAVLAAGLLLVFLVSFTLGRYNVPFSQLIRILASRFSSTVSVTWTPAMESAILRIRLPRILMACLVGCCLATAGTAYQGVFQNPMAAPDLLGASSGAAFGAALAILLGWSSVGVTLSAFVSSQITVLAVYLVGQNAPGKKVVNLILSGIMISSLFSAGTSYIKLVADPSNQLPAITYWLMGSLSGTVMEDVGFVLPAMLVGLIPLFLLRWRINLLTLGDDEATAMGVSVNRLRLIVVACATLITAASVSVSGMIGWVGLVIPHLCRKLVGNNGRVLIPASMLMGAGFLLLVDDVSRTLLATQIPIGILTAFIGAPFFLYLITRKETTV